jgi:hypothetical protein
MGNIINFITDTIIAVNDFGNDLIPIINEMLPWNSHDNYIKDILTTRDNIEVYMRHFISDDTGYRRAILFNRTDRHTTEWHLSFDDKSMCYKVAQFRHKSNSNYMWIHIDMISFSPPILNSLEEMSNELIVIHKLKT